MNLISILSAILKHREVLERTLRSGATVESLTAKKIKNSNAEAVIFDHDGVLGPSLSFYPDDTGTRLIRDTVSAFGPGKVFVLTNTRSVMAGRREAYRQKFPEVFFIAAKKKPDPEGIFIASKLSGVSVNKIAVVDDGILTGALMAVSSGAIPVYCHRKYMKQSFGAWVIIKFTTWPQILFVQIMAFLLPVKDN